MRKKKGKQNKDATLKILGFVNTGVPVQVRPGAPNTNEIQYLIDVLDEVFGFVENHNAPNKSSFLTDFDTTVTPTFSTKKVVH